jgi:hypothetical protein
LGQKQIIEEMFEEIVPVPPPIGSSNWVCQDHHCLHHDIFINYRARNNEETALALLFRLQTSTRKPVVFLDTVCLPTGQDWQTGYLSALQHSKVAVLLISEEGLENIREAHLTEDNVLLEYEYILRAKDQGTMEVCPLFLVNSDKSEFAQFSTDCYSDEPHCSPLRVATGSVRDTMKQLFKLQGHPCPRDKKLLKIVIDNILELLTRQIFLST